MAGFNDDADRKVIPRLRTFQMASTLDETDPLTSPRAPPRGISGLVAAKVAAWRRRRTIGHASDLVGAALTLGRIDADVRSAAAFLTENNQDASHWARELAQSALGSEPGHGSIVSHVTPEQWIKPSSLHAHVAAFRTLVRQEPRDPFSWVDLAFVHACLGQGDQAARSMSVAVQLAPDDRFVLRSAARLWVHLDDPETAHHIVKRSYRTIHDPWLLATEISLASIAKKRLKYVKAARDQLARGQFAPKHISELASAVATLELNAANTRKAKRLFAQALVDPTENSIAQVGWAGRKDRRIHLDREYTQRPNAFEAASWACYQNGEWTGVVENSRRWFADQPFSRRPTTLASFVAATAMQDYQMSKSLAKMGLRANPSDFTLLNNLAYAHLMAGEVEQGADALARINSTGLREDQLITLTATQGLLEFRKGRTDQGRKLYAIALDMARQHRSHDGGRMLGLASLFYALQEAIVNGPRAGDIVARALRSSKRIGDPIAKALVESLERHSAGVRE